MSKDAKLDRNDPQAPAGARVCLMTFPADGDAEAFAAKLVERKAAACVNIVPEIRSVYIWEGKLCREGEVLLIVKTTRDALDALAAAVAELHPYSVPELLVLTPESGLRNYLNWVATNAPGKQVA